MQEDQAIENKKFDLFPELIHFYNLGTVELNKASISVPQNEHEFLLLLENNHVLLFTLYGDEQKMLFILFDKNIDLSTYKELGNILASQIADKISGIRKEVVLVSPPLILSTSVAQELISGSTPDWHCHYLHSHVHRIQLWSFPQSNMNRKVAHA